MATLKYDIIKQGMAKVLVGVYSKTGTTTVVEATSVLEYNLATGTATTATASGAISTMASIGAAIALLVTSF